MSTFKINYDIVVAAFSGLILGWSGVSTLIQIVELVCKLYMYNEATLDIYDIGTYASVFCCFYLMCDEMNDRDKLLRSQRDAIESIGQ